jgi:hypothetical protein
MNCCRAIRSGKRAASWRLSSSDNRTLGRRR